LLYFSHFPSAFFKSIEIIKSRQPLLRDYPLLFTSFHMTLVVEETLDSFITGFKLGARFAYDTFVSDEAPFEDLLKEK